MRCVCNTSPLQYLFQIDAFFLLRDIEREVLVPPEVVNELAAGRQAGIALPDVAAVPWITVQIARTRLDFSRHPELGAGETAAIELASDSPDSIVVLDDLAARRVAEAAGLTVTGTLGLLVRAKARGQIETLAPLMDRLQLAGFRVSPDVRAAVLKLAGE